MKVGGISTPIDSFSGEFDFLSNFYLVPGGIEVNGTRFPSVENAYQAQKAPVEDRRNDEWRSFTKITSAQAKKLGRKIRLRSDWNKIRDDVMFELLDLKFQVPGLRDKLLATGDRELIEGNWWNDTYWGVCKGFGKNKLGKLLMLIRTKRAMESIFQ